MIDQAMRTPTELERAAAGRVGIRFDAGVVGPELRRLMMTHRKAQVELQDRIRSLCKELDIQDVDKKSLGALAKEYRVQLRALLRRRGIVKGARIRMPEEILELHGEAQVGGVVINAAEPVVALQFDGRTVSAYDAHLVAIHATVLPTVR
jgi:hypothetical protein